MKLERVLDDSLLAITSHHGSCKNRRESRLPALTASTCFSRGGGTLLGRRDVAILQRKGYSAAVTADIDGVHLRERRKGTFLSLTVMIDRSLKRNVKQKKWTNWKNWIWHNS